MQNKLTVKEESTLAIFEDDEVWEVTTHKTSHRLSGKQAQALKDLTNSGSRGLVWFDGFAISIPHITSITRIKRGKKTNERIKKEYARKFGL